MFAFQRWVIWYITEYVFEKLLFIVVFIVTLLTKKVYSTTNCHLSFM